MKARRLLLVCSMLFLASRGYACLPPPAGDAGPEIQNRLHSGQDVVLCQGATYIIQSTIHYPVEPKRTDVAIYTEGLPTGSARALLQLVPPPSNPTLATVVDATNGQWYPGAHGAQIHHVRVDGGAQTYGFNGNGALVQFGGPSRNQHIEYVEAKNPRGWSAIQMKDVWAPDRPYPDRCAYATVSNNTVGPAGSWPTNSANPVWLADGLSIGCSYSSVLNNTITDATDVGIAIFGSPYTTFAGNKIYFMNAKSIGGITMSDLWSPNDPDNSGTVVENNQILVGCNGYTPLGISMGRRMQDCNEYTYFSHGARVVNNSVRGRVGYAYAIAGVFWWEATGNTYTYGFCNREPVGPEGHATSACTLGAAPAEFVYEPGYTTGRPDCGSACFQSQFIPDSQLAGSNIRW